VLCALVLAVSTARRPPAGRQTPIIVLGEVVVPGFPSTRVDDPDGPWRRAVADSVELGGSPEWTDQAVALSVPAAWLGRGGWPALWARAARRP
jgi:hypothetical protein